MRNWKRQVCILVAVLVIATPVSHWIVATFGGDAAKHIALVVLALNVALLGFMACYPKRFARRFPRLSRLVTAYDN